MKKIIKNYAAVFVLYAATISAPNAFAASHVYSPNVEKGELEFEFIGNYTMDQKPEKDRKQKHKYAIGYGVTDFWATEVYLITKKAPDQSLKTDAIEWANRFQLTKNPGENFVDVGLYLAYEAALHRNDDHDEIEAKILLEKSVNKFVNRANIGLERQLRTLKDGEKAESGAEITFDWMTKYSLDRKFEPGFEIHSNFGNYNAKHNAYSDQSHKIGPTIYGKIGHFSYDVGYLVGASKATEDQEIKAIIEYEIHF